MAPVGVSMLSLIILGTIVGIPFLALMIWLMIGGKGGGQD